MRFILSSKIYTKSSYLDTVCVDTHKHPTHTHGTYHKIEPHSMASEIDIDVIVDYRTYSDGTDSLGGQRTINLASGDVKTIASKNKTDRHIDSNLVM